MSRGRAGKHEVSYDPKLAEYHEREFLKLRDLNAKQSYILSIGIDKFSPEFLQDFLESSKSHPSFDHYLHHIFVEKNLAKLKEKGIDKEFIRNLISEGLLLKLLEKKYIIKLCFKREEDYYPIIRKLTVTELQKLVEEYPNIIRNLVNHESDTENLAQRNTHMKQEGLTVERKNLHQLADKYFNFAFMVLKNGLEDPKLMLCLLARHTQDHFIAVGQYLDVFPERKYVFDMLNNMNKKLITSEYKQKKVKSLKNLAAIHIAKHINDDEHPINKDKNSRPLETKIPSELKEYLDEQKEYLEAEKYIELYRILNKEIRRLASNDPNNSIRNDMLMIETQHDIAYNLLSKQQSIEIVSSTSKIEIKDQESEIRLMREQQKAEIKLLADIIREETEARKLYWELTWEPLLFCQTQDRQYITEQIQKADSNSMARKKLLPSIDQTYPKDISPDQRREIICKAQDNRAQYLEDRKAIVEDYLHALKEIKQQYVDLSTGKKIHEAPEDTERPTKRLRTEMGMTTTTTTTQTTTSSSLNLFTATDSNLANERRPEKIDPDSSQKKSP